MPMGHHDAGHGHSAVPPPTYIVFFRYDRSTLTLDARHIVDHAAAQAKASKPALIELAGYIGKMAQKGYQEKLNHARMDMIEQALIADGVDPHLLTRVPLADSEAKLPETGDRRVEIWLIDKAPGS